MPAFCASSQNLRPITNTTTNKKIKAISYNSVSERKNELDFWTAESDGQNRTDNPYNKPFCSY